VRTLLELIIAVAIVAFAWEKSLKERADDLPWISDKSSSTQSHSRSSIVNPRASPKAPGTWMRDPKRQSILDTPQPKTTTIPAPSSTAGSSLLDPNHRSPLDPPSKKHPQPTPSFSSYR
jgi:hypothetical protein